MNLVKCAKCSLEFDLMPGNIKEAPLLDHNDKFLSENLRKSYSINRFVCPNPVCKTEQCK